MNQQTKNRLQLFLFAAFTIIAGAGLLKIIQIPNVPLVFYQTYLILSATAGAVSYINYKSHQDELGEVKNELELSLQKNERQPGLFNGLIPSNIQKGANSDSEL